MNPTNKALKISSLGAPGALVSKMYDENLHGFRQGSDPNAADRLAARSTETSQEGIEGEHSVGRYEARYDSSPVLPPKVRGPQPQPVRPRSPKGAAEGGAGEHLTNVTP